MYQETCVIQTPYGRLSLSAHEKYLFASSWVDTSVTDHPRLAILRQAISELNDYFQGNLHIFSIPLAYQGTDFQMAVWNAISTIPYGKKMTYRDVAQQIGKEYAARAVGTALGKNPLCIFFPCHRVITSSGAVGGYVAGKHIKQHLLDREKNH